jgi:hypothetical protein
VRVSQRAHDVRRPIRRPIVDDDDLPSPAVVVERGLGFAREVVQRRDVRALVVRRDDDGHGDGVGAGSRRRRARHRWFARRDDVDVSWIHSFHVISIRPGQSRGV